MSNRYFLGLVLSVTALIAVMSLNGNKPAKSKEMRSLAAVSSTETTRVASVQTKSEVSVASAQALKSVENTSGNTNAVLSAAEIEDLKTFDKLAQKVFLSENEKTKRKALLFDRAFLGHLGVVLSGQSNESDSDKDIALDVLFEAMKSGDQDAAAQALSLIVADARVEDPTLPNTERERIAGLKGEVLYEWSSAQPERTDYIYKQLPGPVSRRVWENVQRFQASNLAESRAQLAAQE